MAMNLSTDDLHRWLNAITRQPEHPAGLMEWVDQALRPFFPFSHLVVVHGELVAGQLRTTHWLEIGHSAAYLEALPSAFELAERGALAWWFAHRRPMLIDPQHPSDVVTAHELDEIDRFGLGNVAMHGILNLRANVGTYFFFSGLPGVLGDWHRDALTLVVPVLNDLYLRYMADRMPSSPVSFGGLTPRQKDIVRLAAEGRDDKAIARGLGIAEKTVRNQLTSVYARLGVSKRSQLLFLLR